MPLCLRLLYGQLATQVHCFILPVIEQRFDGPFQEGDALQDEGDIQLLGHFLLNLLVLLQLLGLLAAISNYFWY